MPTYFGLGRGPITPPGPAMVRTDRKDLNSNKTNKQTIPNALSNPGLVDVVHRVRGRPRVAHRKLTAAAAPRDASHCFTHWWLPASRGVATGGAGHPRLAEHPLWPPRFCRIVILALRCRPSQTSRWLPHTLTSCRLPRAHFFVAIPLYLTTHYEGKAAIKEPTAY